MVPHLAYLHNWERIEPKRHYPYLAPHPKVSGWPLAVGVHMDQIEFILDAVRPQLTDAHLNQQL